MVPPPALSGPGGTGTSITKFVGDGLVSQALTPGSTTTYTINFMNSGTSAATNVVMTDNFPTGVRPDVSSVTVNGLTTGFTATLSGQALTVNVGTLEVKGTRSVKVKATVDAAEVAGATWTNVASVSADGLPAKPTTAATVLVGTANVVYDGLAGQKHVVQGAVVTLCDPVTLAPLVLDGTGIAPNPKNANPFMTGADGIYQFSPFLPGSTTPIAHFMITIVAPGYADRKIDVTTVPQANPAFTSSFVRDTRAVAATTPLYNVTLTSVDGQPLARSGAFTLVTSAVQINNVFDLLGNLPLFTVRPVTVTKTADHTQAAAGDKLIYTISYANNTSGDLGGGSIIDVLPAGLLYIPGSAKIDGIPVTPFVTGPQLVWPLASLTVGVAHKLEYAVVIAPGTPAFTKLTNKVTVGGSIPGTTLLSTGAASVDVFVTRGLFSERMIITGRVFTDVGGSGHFKRGDAGVSNVRVFLESGEFALTDSFGRYTFPGVRPGMHVLRIDPLSLPEGISLFRDFRYDSQRSATRLVHGLLDSGLIQDVNFALSGPPASAAIVGGKP